MGLGPEEEGDEGTLERSSLLCLTLQEIQGTQETPPHPWPPLGRACVAAFLCLSGGLVASLLGIKGPATAPGYLGLGSHRGTS